MLTINDSFTVDAVTDGTSNTLIAAEQSGKVGTLDIRSVYYGGWSGFGGSTKAPALTGSPWGSGTTTIRYTINNRSCPSGSGCDNTWDANTVLNSYHEGGVHVLMADGSVHFASENMEMSVLRAIASKDDMVTVTPF